MGFIARYIKRILNEDERAIEEKVREKVDRYEETLGRSRSSMLGGNIIEVKPITNGFIVIRQSGYGDMPEITYLDDLSGLGDMLTGKLVADRLKEAALATAQMNASPRIHKGNAAPFIHTGRP